MKLTDEQLDAARAHFAQEEARAVADRQAKAEAATSAVKALVASDTFRAALIAFEAAFQAAPKNNEVNYAVQMMERLRDQYPA